MTEHRVADSAAPHNTSVAFIGLGRMGRPMSLNILRAGFPLTVFNRSRGVVDDLASQGATPADSAGRAAAQAEIVCLCLPMPATVEEVVLGPGGVRETIRPGSIVVDFSTIGPATCRRVAAALAERSVAYLDAPVSGGPPGAEAGTLTVMVGGDGGAYQRALPLLQAVGRTIIHGGDVGAGATVKLMNQMLAGINLAGAVEAMVCGVKAGIDPRVLYDTISAATGNSLMLQRNFPDLIMKGDFANRFSVSLFHKDLGLAQDVAREAQVRTLLGALAFQVFEEARALGLGDEDICAAVKPLERLAGAEVRAR